MSGYPDRPFERDDSSRASRALWWIFRRVWEVIWITIAMLVLLAIARTGWGMVMGDDVHGGLDQTAGIGAIGSTAWLVQRTFDWRRGRGDR